MSGRPIDGRHGEPPGYPARGQVETLFAPAHPEIDPEGLIARYLDFEYRRNRQEHHRPISANLHDRLEVLHWYLGELGGARGRPMPLSARALAFLNAPMPLLGLRPEISVAAYGFILNEWPGRFAPGDEASLREALSWWCLERSPRLAPGGELVTQAQVRILTQTAPQDAGRRFPVNDFVRRQRAGDPDLLPFDPETALGRASLVCLLMLRCAERPYLSRFLPDGTVGDLLAVPAPGEPPLFDRLVGLALAEGETPDLAGAARLREGLAARLAPPARPAVALGRHAAPCLVPDPRVRSGLEAGVAVIGPLRAASGLGQAARLSAEVLARAGRPPALLDFGFENPAPTGFASAIRAPSLRTPRRINLLHLNGDHVPVAFAYLDRRLFERSYNIGYVFWELDRVPAFHRLALDLLDEVWVSSEYNRAAYAEVADIPVHNVGMAVEPLPAPVPVSRAEFGLDPEAFVYLATFDAFSFVERKNPLGLVEAFRAAFPPGCHERVQLVLKTQNRTRVGDPHQVRVWRAIDDLAARDPRIRIVDRTLSYPMLLGFKTLCDAYVSLHRSEGLGFGLMEAMQLRLPVVATGYSGNMEFCTPETAFLVDHALVPALPDEYIFVERGSRWAEPSRASAVAALRAVFADPARAARVAQAGHARVNADFGLDAIARRYGARLAAIEATLEATPAA